LTFSEREEIALGRAGGATMRAIAADLGRDVSTVSRELKRDRDPRGCYRATTAHALAYERASRPKPAKLVTNLALRAKVEHDLKRRYSPEQIAGRLRREFPDDAEMWVSTETIYQSLYVQSRGALRRDLTRCLRTGRALLGQLAALEMEENGLGYNNLLYMAVLLGAIADAPQDPEPTLRVLLVEEPEAHLHPQLQELLMHFLQSEAAGATQVIVTTHSPNFASSADVERLTILARASDDELPQSRVPRDFGLDEAQLKHLPRSRPGAQAPRAWAIDRARIEAGLDATARPFLRAANRRSTTLLAVHRDGTGI